MPRSKSQRPGENPADAFSRLQKWSDTNDHSVEGIAEWDIKQQTFVEVLLAMLGDGLAVWFGTTRAGDAIAITLVDGEAKARTYVSDSIEWDDFWQTKWAVMRKGQDISLKAASRVVAIREVGD
jgi:hypothetical protein